MLREQAVQREARELRGKILELENSLDAKESEVDRMRNRVVETERDMAMLQGRVKELMSLASEWETKYNDEKRGKEGVESELKKTQAELDRLKEEVGKLQSELSTLSQQAKRSGSTLASVEATLKDRVTTVEAERDAALESYDKVTAKCDSLRTELNSTKVDLLKVEELAARAGKQVELLTKRLESKEMEMKSFVDSAADFAKQNQMDIARLTTEVGLFIVVFPYYLLIIYLLLQQLQLQYHSYTIYSLCIHYIYQYLHIYTNILIYIYRISNYVREQ